MNIENKNNTKNQEDLDILRKISKSPEISQRKLASELGLSLGKLNYCLIKLKEKGVIKINNFKKNKKKIPIFILINSKRYFLKNTINN